jgi:hypothetical protein
MKFLKYWLVIFSITFTMHLSVLSLPPYLSKQYAKVQEKLNNSSSFQNYKSLLTPRNIILGAGVGSYLWATETLTILAIAPMGTGIAVCALGIITSLNGISKTYPQLLKDKEKIDKKTTLEDKAKLIIQEVQKIESMLTQIAPENLNDTQKAQIEELKNHQLAGIRKLQKIHQKIENLGGISSQQNDQDQQTLKDIEHYQKLAESALQVTCGLYSQFKFGSESQGK